MGVVRAIVTVPLVLPPVVGGVAIFAAFGRNGMLGGAIRTVFGADLPFTYPSIVLAQTFVAMPFLVVTVEGAFRTADRGVEEAAATLGASRLRIFTRVTLPLVLPSVVAGSVLCWARALGEFGATLLVGGNIPGLTQTLPTAGPHRLPEQPVRRAGAEPAADRRRRRRARRHAGPVAATGRRLVGSGRARARRDRQAEADTGLAFAGGCGAASSSWTWACAPDRARCSRCSVRTGRASRRCCAWSPAWPGWTRGG